MQGKEIHLRLQPFLSLLELRHALDDFLIEVKTDSGFRAEASHAVKNRRPATSRVWRRPKLTLTHLAVHRQNNTVYYKRLEPAQFALLTALQGGASLDEAVEVLADDTGNLRVDTQTIGRWFKTWSALGWFCR